MFKSETRLINVPPIRDAMKEYLRRKWISTGNDYSVTELLNPPRVNQLQRRHADALYDKPLTEEEIQNALKSFWGTGLHTQFQKMLWAVTNKNPNLNYLIERKIWDIILGRRIVGKFDCYFNGAIYDFKTTSVWKRIYNNFEDYIHQLNIYAYLLSKDVDVYNLFLILWYNDWEVKKAEIEKDYPPRVETLWIDDLWTPEKQKVMIHHLVQRQIDNEEYQDDELDFCSEQEMWAKPTTYAVTYKGAKKAVRVLPSRDECEEYIKQSKNKYKSKWYIEKRSGDRTRCKQYCKVAEYCNQYQEYLTRERENGEEKKER